MRRSSVALLVLVLALGLAVAAGCGGGDDEATPTDTATETTPSEVEGDPAAGKEIFVANCGGCHTLSDAGTTGTIGPDLDAAEPSDELVVERVTNGLGVMPSFKGTLTEEQIADVAAYVSQSAGG